MTEAVFQFKAIAKRLNCQEQKAEFEEKNPPVDLGMYGYPSNLTPMAPSEWNDAARKHMAENADAVRAKTNLHYIQGDLKTELSLLEPKPLSSLAKPLSSLAHPAWPYTGTPHAWRVKI